MKILLNTLEKKDQINAFGKAQPLKDICDGEKRKIDGFMIFERGEGKVISFKIGDEYYATNSKTVIETIEFMNEVDKETITSGNAVFEKRKSGNNREFIIISFV